MSRVKLNSGLASIILVACLFAGWQTLLIVTALMLIFCEIDDKVRNTIITVVAFFVGLTLIGMAWDLITGAVNVVINGINDLIRTINYYLEIGNQIQTTKLNAYLFGPVDSIVGIADSIVSYLLTFAKFAFIVATVAGKAMKENVVTKKINEYVSKVVTYISNFDGTNVAPATNEVPEQNNQAN